MKKLFFIGTVISLFLGIGCGQQTGTVEISLPKEIVAAIEKQAPASEYGFYALKASYPHDEKDLSKWALIAFGDDPNMDVHIMVSGLSTTNAFLFKSSNSYSIANNITAKNPEDPAATDSSATLTRPDQTQITIPRRGFIFGKGMTSEKLIQRCLDELKGTPESILLTKRGYLQKGQKDLVEIKFK